MNPQQLEQKLFEVTEDERHPGVPLDSIYYQKSYNLYISAKFSNTIQASKQDRFAPVGKHRHPWLELVYIYSGSATLHIGEDSITLSKGQCLLINSGITHSCDACGSADILLNILFPQKYLDQNFFHRFSEDNRLSDYFMQALIAEQTKQPCLFFASEKSRRLPVFMDEFFCEYLDPSVHCQDYLDSYITLILLELANTFSNQTQTSAQNKHSIRMTSILRYMEENYRDCSLRSVADHFHMNANYLSNYIKKYTGKTFKQIIQTEKLSRAASLLINTDLPVEQVARECGYQNISFFYEKFEACYHMRPGVYRIQNGPDA